jgi:hypothetical protein
LLQNWLQQYQAYWGTQEETLENYIAGIKRDHRTLTKLKGRY